MSTSTFKRLSKAIFLIPLAILVLERVAWTVNYDDLVSSAVKAGAEAFNAPPPPENLRGGGGVERLAEEIESGGAQASSRRDLQRRIPLDELAGEQQACADTFVAVPDKHLPYEELFSGNRKIPRIVHQTARSRCVTMKFLGVVDNWFLGDDWAHYFHSDDAIDRLFQQDWPEFPHLRTVLACIDGKGTLKADLWRYLVLWEYGGIYADVDTKPNKFNATTITAEDDGFFIVEQYHILSQYFMATTPRHPIMFYTILHVLQGLLSESDTGMIIAPQITGPHALHRGFQSFMLDKGVKIRDQGIGIKPAKAGFYVGTDERSITVKGRGENENEYVEREYIRRRQKIAEYKAMGMKHFTGDNFKTNKSCMRTLWEAQQLSSKTLSAPGTNPSSRLEDPLD